jgi:hypothetical protein
MVDLKEHPNGGPWVCLTCKGETLEAARARLRPAGAASVPAAVEKTTAKTTADPIDAADTAQEADGEAVDVGDIADEDIEF